MNKYKKSDLAKQLSVRLKDTDVKLTSPEVKTVVTEVFEAMKDLIVDGDLAIDGMIKFEHKTMPDRMYRNPKTGEEFLKPSRDTIKTTVSKKIKNLEL